jgi:heme A synthase
MQLTRFAIYVWGVLIYNLGVILWGAYVRASGSGAGCGSHWPACNGEIIPRAPQMETLVEFSHRLTSGLALLLVVGLLVWAFRAFPRGHLVRLGAVLSLVIIIVEALFGAGLVLFGLTGKNDSVARAVMLGIHLVNTLLLVAALTLTGWWASGGRPLRLRGQGGLGWLFGASLLGMIAVGASGAVTALGDTLFPAGSLAEGIRQDLSPTAHFLVQLRVLHPLLAIGVGALTAFTAALARSARVDRTVTWLSWAVTAAVGIQLAAGVVNLVLLAPVVMQMVHLLLADLLWIALVLCAAAALAVPAAAPAPARAASEGIELGVRPAGD